VLQNAAFATEVHALKIDVPFCCQNRDVLWGVALSMERCAES
jgi:hypothetical protein